MVYTEVRQSGSKLKYYRVFTFRKNGKVVHARKYLGSNLDKVTLQKKEKKADLHLTNPLNTLLSKKDLKILEHIKERHKAKHHSTFENRYEAFCSEFTFDSTGIEGNTLTLIETAAVLFEGATPSKSLREVYEVLNHKKAFDYLLLYKGNVNKKLLCKLQQIITENTLKPELAQHVGKYRTVPVFIRGSKILPPPAQKVAQEMRSLLTWQGKNKHKIHLVILAAYFHCAFEAIHPFVDGNGRTGRLILNLMLHNANYPMISIPRTQKLHYFQTLSQAQTGNLKPFLHFIMQLLQNSEKSI